MAGHDDTLSRAERPLRAITYLAPGIPLGFFEELALRLGRALGRAIEVQSDARNSGPMHGDHDPFAAPVPDAGGDRGMRADIGFLCSPSFLYLRSLRAPTVELVPAGFVFRDARNGGRPLYFSDVIVRADRAVARLEDLAGGVFGFNDTCSLSGYYAARQELARRAPSARTRFDRESPDGAAGFFREERCTGSHAASIEAVLRSEIDVAAIDSNVLAAARRERPELHERLRVVESWGPHPIQPVVVRSELAGEWGPRLARALLALAPDPVREGALAQAGLVGCVPVDEGLYAEERAALEALGQLPSRCD